MFKYIKSFFSALNANSHPGDIAHAVSLGLFLALVPKGNILWIFLFVCFLFVRVNKGAFFISLILLSLAVPFLDVAVEYIGYLVLSIPFLQRVYEILFNIPFVGLTRFNNTMVAGGFITALLLYIPVYFIFRILVVQYRKVLQPKLVNSKVAKIFMKLPIIKQIVNAPDLLGLQK